MRAPWKEPSVGEITSNPSLLTWDHNKVNNRGADTRCFDILKYDDTSWPTVRPFPVTMYPKRHALTSTYSAKWRIFYDSTMKGKYMLAAITLRPSSLATMVDQCRPTRAANTTLPSKSVHTVPINCTCAISSLL